MTVASLIMCILGMQKRSGSGSGPERELNSLNLSERSDLERSGAGAEWSGVGDWIGAGASSTSSVFDVTILVKSTVISVSCNLRPPT